MPKQEVFFEYEIAGQAGQRIEVLKTYDEAYAREAFDSMDEEAQIHLRNSLRRQEPYNPDEFSESPDPTEREAFLWDEMVDQAREDWNTFSFFVVNATAGSRSESLYVSPDWPSAEAFAKKVIAMAQ